MIKYSGYTKKPKCSCYITIMSKTMWSLTWLPFFGDRWMTCSCLWIRGAPEYPWPDFETGASAINRPLHTAAVGDKHMRANPVAQTSLMNTHRSYVHLHIFYYYSSCTSEVHTDFILLLPCPWTKTHITCQQKPSTSNTNLSPDGPCWLCLFWASCAAWENVCMCPEAKLGV